MGFFHSLLLTVEVKDNVYWACPQLARGQSQHHDQHGRQQLMHWLIHIHAFLKVVYAVFLSCFCFSESPPRHSESSIPFLRVFLVIPFWKSFMPTTSVTYLPIPLYSRMGGPQELYTLHLDDHKFLCIYLGVTLMRLIDAGAAPWPPRSTIFQHQSIQDFM